jgi:hypothetical protein
MCLRSSAARLYSSFDPWQSSTTASHRQRSKDANDWSKSRACHSFRILH